MFKHIRTNMAKKLNASSLASVPSYETYGYEFLGTPSFLQHLGPRDRWRRPRRSEFGLFDQKEGTLDEDPSIGEGEPRSGSEP